MKSPSEHLELAAFESLLKTKVIGRAIGWRNEIWDNIDSTNARALALAAEGAPEGIVVASRQQTAGRGRLGRTWVSPPDCGLYISFLLRPKMPIASLPLISLATGNAVARTIEEVCGVRLGLKWVNDIVYGGKKVGGILAEMQSAPALVIGIGINLRDPGEDADPEVRARADNLERLIGAPIDSNLLAAALAAELEHAYNQLLNGEQARVISEWKRHSVTLGRQIRVHANGNEFAANAVDLAPDGGLIVEMENGDRTTLRAGEVTIRNADGTYA